MQMSGINKTLHKWLSLLIGLQLLIWLGTGLYFNLMDSSKASGNGQRVSVVHQRPDVVQDLLPVSAISSAAPMRVGLLWLFERPYYQFIYEQGEHSYQPKREQLFDAYTGEPFSLNRMQALNIARRSYSGDGEFSAAELLEPPFDDYVQQQNPMWRVIVKDEFNTSIYLDGVTGQVLKHVTDDVRLKELMLKLHFMDYGNSGGFNHWLIISVAIATLMLASTGVIWLVQQYRSGLLSINVGSRPRTIAVNLQHGERIQVQVSANDTLLDGLACAQLYLPSICGGGGTCGKCRFNTSQQLSITSADRERISAQDLRAGYRLGCQHLASEVQDIEAVFTPRAPRRR
ncbi:2Fe-2S iron-sulfur cluster-binding protein [Aestuariibacter salexigens]|uniref:2Fe-2S iron-sulfur cluster-binding protein n=1 Tax=Aestuariibacter salexigens TaxID=226010 RepID=UPI000411F157|nr:2Fe-2S iron-sulfur cluster-binding protein [Aestuariibacter salexigens]